MFNTFWFLGSQTWFARDGLSRQTYGQVWNPPDFVSNFCSTALQHLMSLSSSTISTICNVVRRISNALSEVIALPGFQDGVMVFPIFTMIVKLIWTYICMCIQAGFKWILKSPWPLSHGNCRRENFPLPSYCFSLKPIWSAEWPRTIQVVTAQPQIPPPSSRKLPSTFCTC